MQYQLPVASAIGAALILVSLPSQLRAGNVAIVMMIIGSFLLHTFNVANTIVWAGNVDDVAPIWCDFCESSKTFRLPISSTQSPTDSTFDLAWSYMASGVALCVAIYLQQLTSLRCNGPSRVPLEVALSCGLPLISILFRTF